MRNAKGSLTKWSVLRCLLLFAPSSSTAPVSHESGGAEQIVILDKSKPTPPKVAEILARLDLHEQHPDVRYVFNNSAFIGFAASMKSHCLDLLANMTEVSKVEQAVAVSKSVVDTRQDAPWGLQRISTPTAFGGSASAMDYTYSYTDSLLGSGSDIYFVDTGLFASHSVFNGRAEMLWSYNGDMRDLDGHGTHVAGTAAGDILGVASNANLFGVKALDSEGGGLSSNVVAGIDYVVKRHDARKAAGKGFVGSVISMSLASSSPVEAINMAVNAAISNGIHVCVAAGNTGDDACKSSPASAGGAAGQAISVGAVDMDDQRASFSNHGKCVDLYGPGVGVVSSWIGGNNVIKSLSGTSMAAPHVTGIIAYAMANRTLANSPRLMKDWLLSVALPLSDGTVLANNGVQASWLSSGFIGLERIHGR